MSTSKPSRSDDFLEDVFGKPTWMYKLLVWILGGGDTPLLEGERELPLDWPPFWHFQIQLGPFYAELDFIDPTFLQSKIGLSLSHLVPESNVSVKYIIWPFSIICFPWFSILFTHLFCSQIFFTSYFSKTLDPVVSIFITTWTLHQTICEVLVPWHVALSLPRVWPLRMSAAMLLAPVIVHAPPTLSRVDTLNKVIRQGFYFYPIQIEPV